MSLERKLLLTIFVFITLAVSVFQYALYEKTRVQAEQDLLQQAEQIRNVLMATRRVYHHQFIDSGIPLTEQTLGFLPAHAMRRISADFGNWDDSGLSFNNVSGRPRNPDQAADAIERQAIEHFQKNPDSTYRFAAFEQDGSTSFFHYSQPIWIEAYCLGCHGTRSSAPETIRAIYDSAYDYQLGELKGILSIRIPSGYLEKRIQQNLVSQLGWSLPLLMLVALSITWSVRRFVTTPLTHLGRGMEQLADGDLDHRIGRLHGEFRRIGETFNTMALGLDRQQREIRQSEERFRTLVETAQDGIILVNRDGEILLWNSGAARIFGYCAEEISGHRIDGLMPERYRGAHRAGLERVNRGASSQYIGSMVELYGLHREGREFPIEISLNTWLQDGERYHLAILRDISERKSAEQRLVESERKFQTMVDWTQDWEYWIHPDASFNYSTPSVFDMTGYRAAEFEAHPSLIDDIVHPDDRERWLTHLQHHLHGASDAATIDIELRLIRKDNKVISVEHSCRSVTSEDGRYLGRRVSVRDITIRKAAEARAQHLAYHDALTGLPNRILLLERLERALARSTRSGQYGAVIMLDLDHFKKLNDAQGHSLGDQLLIEVARRLEGILRKKDTVARLGGDEFIVAAEDLGDEVQPAAARAEGIAEQARRALAEPVVLDSHSPPYDISASLGLTLFRGEALTVDNLLQQADLAMYQAKDSGRDNLRFFNAEMQAAIQHRTALEQAMKRALGQQEFQLYYQPQVDGNGHWIGVEALLRWQDPEKGLIAPGEFIPLAEQSGLILGIGRWVIDSACHQIRVWSEHPQASAWTVAVNVSARQFHQDDFVDSVIASLERSGAAASRLKLELTEGIVIDNVEAVIARMRALARIGVTFSLDDFGTGYSSLSYLKRLPINQIKIDQSFVRDVVSNPEDAGIVRAVLAMGDSLAIATIAEGVETEEQRHFLHQNGCTAYQGYLFGRPMPVAELMRGLT